ncbi:MAG: FG-GAP-like repeat-containing protein [Bifidobacteriaceae bacterium]|jgi:hypothetical protein|nr:FG-GAP-like repeat-containing protein [Bifidobacteriaceae bacterium]
MALAVAAVPWQGSVPAQAEAPVGVGGWRPMAVTDPDAIDGEVVAAAVATAIEAQDGGDLQVTPEAATPPPAEAAPVIAPDGPAEEATVEHLDLEEVASAEVVITDPAGDVNIYVTEAMTADQFSVAGVSWQDGPEPSRILARAYQDGVWTEWYDLEIEESGPDPDTEEAAMVAASGAATGATGPMIAVEAQAIQVQVLSQPGEDLPNGIGTTVVPDAALDAADATAVLGSAGAAMPQEVSINALVSLANQAAYGSAYAADGGSTPSSSPTATATSTATATATASASPTATATATGGTSSGAKPTIHLRSEWNARSRKNGPSVIATELKGAIIHHTAGSNSYSQSQVPAVIKGIQNYHMDSNKWDDIGYNFLVDKYGGIWEGREGGITLNVVGAHAFEFNTGSVGISMLGNFETVEPTAEALTSVKKLLQWRLPLGGVNLLNGTTVYPKDEKKQTKAVVSGHRDVNSTSCPGKYLYRRLADFRVAVSPGTPEKLGPYSYFSLSQDIDDDKRGEILAIRADSGVLDIYRPEKTGLLYSMYIYGPGWSGRRVFGPGDWDGDKKADLISVTPGGVMYLHKGDGAGGLSSKAIEIGHGWTSFRIIPAGDLTQDGVNDLLAIDASGRLWLYAGNGKGSFVSQPKQVGQGWVGLELYAAGDLNGDGKNDILAVLPDSTLWAYQGRGNGTFNPPKRVGWGWGTFQLAAGADLNGDKLADIVGRNNATGELFYYQGNGGGSFKAAKLIAKDW